jgi:hypothetical protein
MRTKEILNEYFTLEFPNVNIIDMITDKSLFSGVISGKAIKQFSLNMYSSRIVNIGFVWDIEENKYYFTELK